MNPGLGENPPDFFRQLAVEFFSPHGKVLDRWKQFTAGKQQFVPGRGAGYIRHPVTADELENILRA